MDEYFEQLIYLGRSVSKYCVGMEGNVSCRYDASNFLIKASGSKLSSFSFSDIVKCKYGLSNDEVMKLNKRPSIEYGLHDVLLSYYPYVAHTHPVNTVSILCSEHRNRFSRTRLFPDHVVCNGKESLFIPYDTPGQQLTYTANEVILDYYKEHGMVPNTILLENHGLFSCGNSVEQCISATEICEKAATVFLNTCMLGYTKYLTVAQVDDILSLESEKYRMKKL